MSIGERIKKVRKDSDLTQQEFANKIGSKRNTVATYEMGRTEPSAAVISLICREFNVSEEWLRTGVGEMFVKRTDEDELAQVLSAISASDDELIKRIIRAYWRLDDKEKATVKKLIDGLSSDGSSPTAPAFAPAHIPNSKLTAEQEIEREVERYRQQLLLEKERALQVSSARESGAG